MNLILKVDYALCLFTSADQEPSQCPTPPTHRYTQNLRPIKHFGICRNSRVLGDLEISNQPQGYINSPC